MIEQLVNTLIEQSLHTNQLHLQHYSIDILKAHGPILYVCVSPLMGVVQVGLPVPIPSPWEWYSPTCGVLALPQDISYVEIINMHAQQKYKFSLYVVILTHIMHKCWTATFSFGICICEAHVLVVLPSVLVLLVLVISFLVVHHTAGKLLISWCHLIML